MVSITYVFIVSITLYIVVIYHVSNKLIYMSSNGLYTDIKPCIIGLKQ